MKSIRSVQRKLPRKQPSQVRSRQTVEAIIEAAARILEDQGQAGFTTNAVAELAGVSVGSLYQYFPDKEALTGALIARETSLLLADAELAIYEKSGSIALEMLIEAAVRHQLRRPALARLLDFEEGCMPLDVETQRVRRSFQEIVASILSRSDFIPQSDSATAALDIAAIIQGMLDAAGQRGESAHAALNARVRRAVMGYLNEPVDDGAPSC